MTMHADTNLTPELRAANDTIREVVARYGLEPYETIFELVDFDEINEVAAFGGFPTRYPHWRFGMEYDQLSKGYAYGLSKIYELVINNDPCYAYLMRGNELVAQRTVIAHVYGHSDFFRNNAWFAKTSRKMMDEMANHATRIRRHVDRHGLAEVERFLETCLSLESLIDPYAPYVETAEGALARAEAEAERDAQPPEVRKIQAKAYMDRFINPPEFLQAERQRLETQREKQKRVPEAPEADVLRFLIEHANTLEPWQRDILEIVRKEAYYFAPQRMTKIMNEGWASYWHATIMGRDVCTERDIVDFADLHAGTMTVAQGQLNPYALGLALYRDIEERWNTGRHGQEYEACDDAQARAQWDTQASEGRAKIFEVRRFMNDIGFIETYLTKDFCERAKLFTYAYNEVTGNYEITSRDFETIKRQILFALTNSGMPAITVHDGNYHNRGELLLTHRTHTDGASAINLRLDYAEATLKNVGQLWGRPVHLYTIFDERDLLLSWDGETLAERHSEP